MPFQKRVKSDKTKEQYKAEFQAGLSAVKKAPKGTTKKQIVEKAVLQLLAILGKDTANVKYNITNLVALFVCNVTGDVLGSVPYNMSQNLWLNTIQPILRDHANDAEFSVCVESWILWCFLL